MDENKRKTKKKVDIEMLDPTYRTAILDGYALAIQKLGQTRRDNILAKIVRN